MWGRSRIRCTIQYFPLIRFEKAIPYLYALALQVCRKYKISLDELRSGSRRRVVVEDRGSISWIAVKELGYSGADVARYLGVTNSCVTRFVSSGKKPDVDDLVRNL
ncbi:hypothetical protein D1BOALGB6SA_9985 [Olavius sp. associated proteobacterium Delta 1]|nr:hypothetical protein D1BOALGB6SA_9985 [Olavius sp. associated proteobacterium Delta 1]